LLAEQLPDLRGIKVVRAGWYLGGFKKKRFEPSQAMAMALKKEDVLNVADYPLGAQEVIQYLKGETVNRSGLKGWTLVCVDGYPLGWGKQVDGILKNYYPKGWRWLD